MGNPNIDVLSKQITLCRPSYWNTGTSIFDVLCRANKPNCSISKFPVVLRPPGCHRIQWSGSGKFLTKAVAEEKKINLHDPSSQQFQVGVPDSSLESTFTHRMWVAAGCGALVGMIIKSVIAMDSVESFLAGLTSGFLGYVVADIGSGIYHWGIDNYGDANTPIFGSQIDAFQGHHRRPWTITRRQFANNIHSLARPATLALVPFLLLPNDTVLDSFVGVLMGCAVFSQQFHCWSHCRKSELPSLVIKLQEKGILVSRLKHAAHHRAPYDNNYCIVSGMWNPLLDNTKFFRKLEMLIYSRWAIRPRCWGETTAEWLQDGSYFGDGPSHTSSKQ